MKIILIHIIVLLLIGCQNESEICGDLDDVHYVVNYYYQNMDKVDHIEYYNSKDQILRRWKPTEEILNYKYDTNEKLIEVQYSRSCRSVSQYRYQIYNDKDQLISEKISRIPIISLDSIRTTQTKYYNEHGLLEKESLNEKGNQVTKHYVYENGKLLSTTVRNEDNEPIKIELNFYGLSDLIDSTVIKSNGNSWVEVNHYDLNKRLKTKRIKSNTIINTTSPNIDRSKVTFDNFNHVRTYEYQDGKNIIIERRIGNDDKSHLTIIKEKKYAA